ncbi:MAG: hypothetical protein R3D29_10260 [Nitratireductor sp.]
MLGDTTGIQTTSHTDSSYSWLRLAISVLAGTLTNIGMWAAILVLPAVQAEFGVDRADASMSYTP